MKSRTILPFEYAIIGYLSVLTIVILLFGRPLSMYYDELIMNILFSAIVLSMIRFMSSTDNNLIRFIRLLYPVALFTFFYRQTGGMMFIFFEEFQDLSLVSFEKAIFGLNPTLWIDKNLLNVWLTEILSASYMAYYLMIPVFMLVAFLKKKYNVVKDAQLAVCLTFFISYALFFCWPIEGPRYFLESQYINPIEGPIFRSIVEFIQLKGSVHGGCMPSSHVAVALVINVFCLKYFRRVGYLLLIINFGMVLGTFYGRYHYVSDVVVGAIIGIGVALIVIKYKFLFKNKSSITESIKAEKIKSVS